MLFNDEAYKENERRKVTARKLEKFPYNFQQLIIDVLNHNARRSDLFQTCTTCEHFSKEEICKLANQRPPANVIADGCTEYKDFDEIPF